MPECGGENGAQSGVDFSGTAGRREGHAVKANRAAFGVPHLSTGDMFRDAVTRGSDLGKQVRPIMERGELVPDDLVMKMVEERLSRPDCAGGFVFDGFPRTLPQAEQLDGILEKKGFGKPIVVDFAVSAEKLCGGLRADGRAAWAARSITCTTRHPGCPEFATPTAASWCSVPTTGRKS